MVHGTGSPDTDYVPTQVIAELYKSEGYDGIAYKRAFGDDGYNIAVFNLDDARVKSCVLHDGSVRIRRNRQSLLGRRRWINKCPSGDFVSRMNRLAGAAS